jgi:hypothetical protein
MKFITIDEAVDYLMNIAPIISKEEANERNILFASREGDKLVFVATKLDCKLLRNHFRNLLTGLKWQEFNEDELVNLANNGTNKFFSPFEKMMTKTPPGPQSWGQRFLSILKRKYPFWQQAQSGPSYGLMGENLFPEADNDSNNRALNCGDSSFDPQDDRAYIQYAFQEIEDELIFNPKGWQRNIEAVIALINAGMLIWTAIYSVVFTSIDGTQYTFMTAIVVNFLVFTFFLYLLFFVVRKTVCCLCVHYRVIRPVEEYKNICKRFFFILLIPSVYFFYVYILWLIPRFVVVYDKTIFQRLREQFRVSSFLRSTKIALTLM